MVTIEDRVASIDGKVVEHSHMLDGIREAIVSLEDRLDRRLQAFEVRMDQRFEQVDKRFEQLDRRFELMERRFERGDQRTDAIDAKLSRQFVFLVGLHLTTLIALVSALGGIIAAILRQ